MRIIPRRLPDSEVEGSDNLIPMIKFACAPDDLKVPLGLKLVSGKPQ